VSNTTVEVSEADPASGAVLRSPYLGNLLSSTLKTTGNSENRKVKITGASCAEIENSRIEQSLHRALPLHPFGSVLLRTGTNARRLSGLSGASVTPIAHRTA
jgi:hypothetical protein